MKERETVGRFNLVTGQDTYASQTAQNPATSRKLKSWIPSLAGDLEREKPLAKYLAGQIVSGSTKILGLYEFQRNDSNGVVTRYHFVFASNNKLYQESGGAWVEVTAVGTLAGIPMTRTINDLFHLWDGTTAWLFDGTTWVKDGLPIPLKAAELDVSAAGTLSITTNRYYWTSYADETAGRKHESSSSPISAGTGGLTSKKVKVYQRKGTCTVSTANADVTGSGTDFHSGDVGMKLYVNGVLAGTIATVTNATTATLEANSATSQTAERFVIAPVRATHWHIYASESENSKVGFYLASVAVTTMVYEDESPFLGTANSLFLQIERPVRNDPPVGSNVLEVHKDRLWGVRKKRPIMFFFGASEEVSANNNGAAEESFPGLDDNTVSDLINEARFPLPSNRIRGLKSHGEALYVGTEKQIVPLYGDSINDFAISQLTAFAIGIAGRFAWDSTPYGMPFLSYGCRVYLYPTTQIPVNQNATSALIEIGLPLRNELKTIDRADLDNVHLKFYDADIRNWLVLSFKNSSGTYRAFIYDFDTNSWFELQRGFCSLDVWEYADGKRALIGGGEDGYVYVIDDIHGTYTGAAVDTPQAVWRPALIDFGAPDDNHVIRYLEIEKSNKDQLIDITYWFDPVDVDNPGAGRNLVLTKMKIGSNLYRGFFLGGSTCKRLLLEFKTKTGNTQAGKLRGVVLKAEPASGLQR